MKKIFALILTALFGGCYTELYVASREPASALPVSNEPIIIIVTDPCPSPPPPYIPIIIHPVTTTVTPLPAAEPNRIRTNGSTRDNNERGGRTRK